MRRPRALHLIGGGDTGGAMSHLLPLLRALGPAGCDVHLACLGGGGLADEAERRGLALTVLPMKGAHDFRVLGSLRRLLADGPAERPGTGAWDIVHTHGMRANLPVRLALGHKGLAPCLVTTVHSDIRLDYDSSSLARLYEALDRGTLGRVDCVICMSSSLRGLLIDRGYPPGRLVAIHSGLETATGGATAAAVTRSRPRVGSLVRLVAVKDVDLMLEVAGLLRRTHPDVEMIVMGDGPESERLQRVAGETLPTGTVRFTGRMDDVRSALSELDVYLVTSLYEGGVSMSVLEAMESGLPVVTTAAGGVEEAVVDGETGYVVSRGQDRGALAAALAERTAALLDDPALRARMGAAGARRVRSEFTIERTAAQTLRAYERCLAVRAARF